MGRWKQYEAEERGYVARSFFLNVLDPLAFWLDQRRWRPSELARRRAGRLRAEIPGNGRTIWFGPRRSARTNMGSRWWASWRRSSPWRRRLRPAAGAKLLVAYVPRKERVYQDLCTFDADSEVPHYHFGDLPERLGAWCGQQKIEYLDLTPD